MVKWKMRKGLLWMLVLVLMFPLVSAWDLCGGETLIANNCTLITPVIGCVVENYTVMNESGGVVQSGNLSAFGNGVSYFNFSQDAGEYVVRLCDGGVREVLVGEEGGTVMLAILVLLPLLLGFMMLYMSSVLGDEHNVIKIFLWLIAPVTFWVSAHFGMVSLIKVYDFVELEELLASTTYWVVGVFILLAVYVLIYIFYTITRGIAEEKIKRFEY